jgi:hypothetical protein
MGTHHGRHRHRVVGVAAATRGVSSSSPVEEKAEGPVVEGADENSIFYWVACRTGPGCWPCDLARPGAELGARNQVDWATYLVLGLLVY